MGVPKHIPTTTIRELSANDALARILDALDAGAPVEDLWPWVKATDINIGRDTLRRLADDGRLDVVKIPGYACNYVSKESLLRLRDELVSWRSER